MKAKQTTARPKVAHDRLVRCGILGCGNLKDAAEMRAYHLIPGQKIPACPECWEGMGIPPDYRDSEDYKADYEAAKANGSPTANSD